MTVFPYGNHHFLVNKKPTAQAYRALLNVLALPLSPLGSEGGAPGIPRWRPCHRDWKTITENGPYSTTIIGFLGTTQLGICKGPLGTGDSPWLDGQWGRLLLSWGSYCPSQCRNACEWTGLYSWSNQVPVPSNSPEVLWLCNGLSGTWTRTGGFSLSVRLPIGKKTCGYRKPVFTMLVTGNLTGPHPIFHWKPCISWDLPHQSFESLVHPQRARSAGKAGLRNFSPLSPLSGPAETSNTVVLPFYHVFF